MTYITYIYINLYIIILYGKIQIKKEYILYNTINIKF